ncbi:dihydrofolate reductase [Rhodococcus sp. 15-725-2-2b]|uniref:dihydrofolate reductase family protein n=1 Tax=unclassified Rhodococcus (in: high G+C Gram-positive bacteria) TaxID=192944 RepID=UPI000B9C0DB8|nr:MULTISPECIES: dihydrofolate reductase family protein [unclassified Rhodococcus (in: high G+C Gram-positive bacteria)]OZC69903.1 dihydrofolate reductase [Rhodococcus sp. 06-469-3-2]OZD40263.1 dihydrofolate reductase [Rhodococcus sp. 06-1477-1A]OZE02695.1 dihydrofolate reductase [Rhodococcus sp. 05-2255-3C]OZE11240.1 dihydrofolate reductase [Rhodococcus sp. 05-2255-3B1]OZE12965.1 dihydrofolate reductase [Rhodococcus sp. 05-2255-2A2]
MRSLVITQNITVDGVIEATDDWFARAGGDPELDAALAAQRDESDGFLVGRSTFESMRDYWGPKTDDTTGVTDHLNRVAKYVVSSTLTDPGWVNSTVLSGRLIDEVTRIKNSSGSDIVCTGSITLCRELIALDLVDEYRLFQFPYVRGHGERLFDGTPSQWLRLLECRAFPSGASLVRYATRR